MELIGPMKRMNLLISSMFHGRGLVICSSSTLSAGIGTCEKSYSRLLASTWIGAMGTNGRNALAPRTLNMFPKFELAPMRMYFTMLAKTFRPSRTPSSSTIRFFSSRIRSADSLAMSTAVSTEMPTSAARRAGASLIPSPMNPTTWFLL